MKGPNLPIIGIHERELHVKAMTIFKKTKLSLGNGNWKEKCLRMQLTILDGKKTKSIEFHKIE